MNDGISGTPFERHVDGVFSADEYGTVIGVNDRFVALTGFSRQELVGKGFDELFDPDLRSALLNHAAQARTGASRRLALKGTAKDGHPLELVLTLLASDEPQGIIGVARDARADIESLERPDVTSVTQTASRLARFSGWSIDVDSGVTTWGEEMFAILGFDEAEAPDYGRTLDTFYDEPYRSQVEHAVSTCIAEGTLIDLQVKIRNLQGAELDARIIGQGRRNVEGRVVRVEGAFYDITDVVRTRDVANASHREVADLFHSVSVPLFLVGRDWKLQYVNRAGFDLAHLNEDVVGSVTIWDLFPEIIDTEMEQIYRAAMDEGRFGATTGYIGALDGDFEVVVYPTPNGILVTGHNVTNQREAIRQRAEFAERSRALAQMLDLTNDAVIVRNLDYEVTYWNHAAEELYGWTSEEMVGRSPLPLLYDDTSEIEAALATVMREGYWSGELIQRARDGRRVVVETRQSLSRDASGEPTSIFSINTDVTALRERQEARIRAQRMESLGTLAGGIAHDLNNVLTPMVMSLDLLLARTNEESARRLLESMNSSVTRASQMVRQVLTFARGVEGERVVVPIERLLHQVQEFCRDVLPKNIDVIVDVTNHLGAVIGDETQLMQVLVNLVTNARDAMHEGGVLTIRARNVSTHERDSEFDPEGRWIAITVSDTGDGMDDRTQARVFEPFFTTKEFGQGTGLGLSTSSAIVESHGGRLLLDSKLGRGTTFTLEMPCEPDATEKDSPATLSRQGRLLPTHRSQLLIVDDEEAIVNLLTEVLRDSGYEVDAATSGEAALVLLRDRSTPYDLILSDVNVPKLSGVQLANRARQLGVTSTFAFMSGVSNETLPETLGDTKVQYYLQKPFTVAQLLDFVDEVLTSSRR